MILYGFCPYAAAKGLSEALKHYKNGFNPEKVLPFLEDEHTFENRFDYKGFSERSRLAHLPS